MTYEEFIAEIKAILFPDREAINLSANHSRYILDGLIWLQKRVPQLQDSHYDIENFEDTFYRCCTTVIPKPDGIIRRVYTFTADNQCDAIFYQPVTVEAMLSNVRSSLACGCTGVEGEEANIEGDPLSFALKQATDQNNKDFRAASGIWAIVDKQIWIYPYINSNEKVGIHWRGVKLQYDEDDPIVMPLDARSVIELYAKMQVALREDCDTNEYAKLKVAVEQTAGDLTWWYRRKDYPPEMEWRGSGCEMCLIAGTSGEPPEPAPGKTFDIYLGNAGPLQPPTYTPAEIKGLQNTLANPVLRSQVEGMYEISAPASGTNEFRVIAIPVELYTGNLQFTSAGLGLPMDIVDELQIDGIQYRIFRTTIPSAGDFTFPGQTAIAITVQP